MSITDRMAALVIADRNLTDDQASAIATEEYVTAHLAEIGRVDIRAQASSYSHHIWLSKGTREVVFTWPGEEGLAAQVEEAIADLDFIPEDRTEARAIRARLAAEASVPGGEPEDPDAHGGILRAVSCGYTEVAPGVWVTVTIDEQELIKALRRSADAELPPRSRYEIRAKYPGNFGRMRGMAWYWHPDFAEAKEWGAETGPQSGYVLVGQFTTPYRRRKKP